MAPFRQPDGLVVGHPDWVCFPAHSRSCLSLTVTSKCMCTLSLVCESTCMQYMNVHAAWPIRCSKALVLCMFCLSWVDTAYAKAKGNTSAWNKCKHLMWVVTSALASVRSAQHHECTDKLSSTSNLALLCSDASNNNRDCISNYLSPAVSEDSLAEAEVIEDLPE